VRKVVAVELVSLDGFVEAPEEWALSYLVYRPSDEEST
jgi:hypothetical protein